MTSTPADIASVQTLPQLLAYRAARTPQAEAYRAMSLLLRTAFASWGACGKHKPPAALAFGIPPKRQTGLRPDCLQAQPANCL